MPFLVRPWSMCSFCFFILCGHRIEVTWSYFIKNPFCNFGSCRSKGKNPIIWVNVTKSVLIMSFLCKVFERALVSCAKNHDIERRRAVVKLPRAREKKREKKIQYVA